MVGKKLAAAKPALKRRLCRAGKVTKAYSRKVKKGRVISQSRRAGRVLPVNSKVNLVVSRGPKRVVRPADARDLRRARSLPHNR